ncbi:MAG: NHL repeat-containing protein [candidate division Zixibacteria bacterium]|nr:NHL repeat-containing protein [candidate division Zixibacteria bacterium]
MRSQSLTVVIMMLVLVALGSSDGIADDINSRIVVTGLVFDDGANRRLRNPSSLHYDANAGEVVIADAGNSRILIYDRDLIPRYSFDHFVPDRSTGQLVKGQPKAVAVNSHGEIIISDNLVNYLEVLDFRGRPIEKIFLDAALGDTSLTIRPECFTIDEQDNLYVVTTGDLVTVLVLGPDYQLKRSFGQKGTGPTDFNTVISICHRDGWIYLADVYATPAVKVFDTAGAYIKGFGGHQVDRADVSLPSGIAVMVDGDGQKYVWIVDGLRQVIKVLDSEGAFQAFVGGFGFGLGEFRYPTAIAFSGNVFYVLEKVGGRIQSFRID